MDGLDSSWLHFGEAAVLGGPKTCSLIRGSSPPVMQSRSLAAWQVTPGNQTGACVTVEFSDSLPTKIMSSAFMFVCVWVYQAFTSVSGIKCACVHVCVCVYVYACVDVWMCEPVNQAFLQMQVKQVLPHQLPKALQATESLLVSQSLVPKQPAVYHLCLCFN